MHSGVVVVQLQQIAVSQQQPAQQQQPAAVDGDKSPDGGSVVVFGLLT